MPSCTKTWPGSAIICWVKSSIYHDDYRFIISPRSVNDPRSAAYLADAHALG